MLSRQEIEAGLPQFTGTTQWYRHQRGILLTDGAKWLADSAGCYWLYDIIWSVLPKLRGEEFACLHLTVDLDKRKATVLIDDGNDTGKALHRQRVPFTDFPLPEIKLFICDGERGEKVVMLPGEY